MKKNDKLKRERTKSEAMSELERERKAAADELKKRLAVQESEQCQQDGGYRRQAGSTQCQQEEKQGWEVASSSFE